MALLLQRVQCLLVLGLVNAARYRRSTQNSATFNKYVTAAAVVATAQVNSSENMTSLEMQDNAVALQLPQLNVNGKFYSENYPYGWGENGGSKFDHYNYDGLAGGIVGICMYHANHVDRMWVNYAGRNMSEGSDGRGGKVSCFNLRSGETISKIIIWESKLLYGIQLITNQGRFSQVYGSQRGYVRSLGTRGRYNGMHLMGIYGMSSNKIWRIGFYWGLRGEVSGSWNPIPSCVGCASGTLKFTSCSERSGSSMNQQTQDWSVGVTTETSAGFDFKALSGGVKTTIQAAYASQVVQSNTRSFKATKCVEQSFTCNKSRIWQWTFSSNFDGRGSVATHGEMVCTDEARPCCMPGTFTAESGPRSCVLDPSAPNTCR